MDSKSNSDNKRIIICDVCSEFKAKFRCEECDKLLCVKCRTRFGETTRQYAREIICFACRDKLTGKNPDPECQIL